MRQLYRLTCLLSLMLMLAGCMTRLQHDDPDAQAAIQQIVDTIVGGRRDRVAEMASMPFWLDRWLMDVAEVQEELGVPNPEEPKAKNLLLRIYPLADLAVLKPTAWEKIQHSDPAYLKDLVLGAVAIELDGQPEAGLILLRKVEGRWKLAGLVEN